MRSISFNTTSAQMALPYAPGPNIIIVPATSLATQPWWKALHLTINTAFQNKDMHAFPPSWGRLPHNPREGAVRLTEELGPDGVIAVVMLIDRPIACAGALHFRGPNWLDNEKSVADDDANATKAVHIVNGEVTTPSRAPTEADHPSIVPNLKAVPDPDPTSDWEICCFCVHPIHRKIGLSPKLLKALIDHIKGLGAKRLFANYVIEETGHYWPHMGFETIPGAGGVLKKGFTHTRGMEGLRADIHFAMGVKTL